MFHFKFFRLKRDYKEMVPLSCQVILWKYIFYELFKGAADITRKFSSERNEKDVFIGLWHYIFLFSVFHLFFLLDSWIYIRDYLNHKGSLEHIFFRCCLLELLIFRIKYWVNCFHCSLIKEKSKSVYKYFSNKSTQTINKIVIKRRLLVQISIFPHIFPLA